MDDRELYMARQPVFDVHGRVWGYKLLFRDDAEAQRACMDDPEACTLAVVASLLVSPDKGFSDAMCVINATMEFITRGYARGLACESLALSVTTEILGNGEALAEMHSLRKEGVRFLLDVRDAAMPSAALLNYFDVVETHCDHLQDVVAALPAGWLDTHMVMAKQVETADQREKAEVSGARLFLGYFFQHPDLRTVRTVSASLIGRLKILQILEDDVQDIRLLTQAVEADVSITVRLLRLINSPVFAFRRRIDSIRQAISLLGWDKLRNWLRLIVVSDMNPEEKTNELAYSSAVRARFLQLLALYSGRPEMADKLYLVGLFSMLEAMLERPYAEIFADLHLATEVEDALLGKGGQLQPWYDFMKRLDSGDWLHLDAAAAVLGVELKTAGKAQLESYSWANAFFRSG